MEYRSYEFELVNLPLTGKHWDTDISSGLLQEKNNGQIDALNISCSSSRWFGKISREDHLWHMQASFALSIRRCCDRCLSEFDWKLSEQCQRSFAIAGCEPEEMDEDEVTVVSAPGRLNLVDLLREEIWLAWKPVVICREQCKGLCKHCGCNLNTAQCQCNQADEDHPFAALRSLNFDD